MAKKGIAVLQSDGTTAHKLLDDGTATLGDDSANCSITLKGSKVMLDGLNVVSAGAEKSGSIAHAVNAVSSSLETEITNSDTRISNLKTCFDDLAATAHGAGSDRDTSYSAPTGTTFAGGATSLLNADEKLNDELVRQLNALTVLEGSDTTAGSVRKKIKDETGDLSGAQLDKLQEFAASMNDGDGVATTFARDMLVAIGRTIDELDGITNDDPDSEISQTLLSVSSSIEANRLLNEYETSGTQYDHKGDIETINQEMGFSSAGALVAATPTTNGVLAASEAHKRPVARDIAIAEGANTLAGDVDTLIDTHFQASGGNQITLTMTAAGTVATLNGAMACSGEFQVPMVTDVTPYLGDSTAQAANSGKMFFLNDTDSTATARAGFEDGKKFYFCEDGVWYASEMLLDETA
jgi:hypothetical protein